MILSFDQRALVFALSAACLGGAMAWRVDFFHGPLWFVCAIGLVCAQASAAVLHRWLDHASAAPDETGDAPARRFPLALLPLGGAALGCGGWLVSMRGAATFDLLLAGVVLILFYTWPLRRYGLGEIVALLVWGPLTVHGTFYVVAGGWSPELVLVALLFAVGPTATLLAEHIDRLDSDDYRGIRTLPVMLGASNSRTLIKWSIALQYALLCTLFYNETLGWPLLLVLLCATRVPALWTLLDAESTTPIALLDPVFAHARLFNVAFVAAVVVDVAF